MPDAISEPMACYCLGFQWNRGTQVGDATDPNTSEKIEFKASSNYDGDLSSFGPDTKFDKLYFLRFNLEKNTLTIYDLGVNSKQLGDYPANKTQTIREQQLQGRRPHVRLLELFVEKNNLQPVCVFDIRRVKVVDE